jgi:hypothetical protein
VDRVGNLFNTTIRSRDNLEIRLHPHNVCHLPAAGTQTIDFDIPAGTFDGSNSETIYARFRVFTSRPSSPDAAAFDGEVEEYAWNFGPTAITLQSINATATTSANWLVAALLAGFATLVGAFVLRKWSL